MERARSINDGYFHVVSDNRSKPDRGLFGRVTAGATDRMLNVVDPNTVLEHVDVNSLLERIDADALLERVDVDALLDSVDIDVLLDNVDVNRLLDRVDVNRLLDRVEVDRLMARVDVDALLERVDVNVLVERAGIPEIVAESTSHLTGSALDLFRRPLVGLDEIFIRLVNGLFRRDISNYPEGPADLIDWVEQRHGTEKAIRTGRYAGPITRLLAVLIDGFVVTGTFTAMIAALWFTVGLFVNDLEPSTSYGIAYVIALTVWAITYLWVAYTVFGKTIGKMVLGLRVVTESGDFAVPARSAFLRVLTYPLSFILLGLGLAGVIFNSRRQAWHDRFAHTAVVYDWGSRAAALPSPLAAYLARSSAET